MPYTTRNNPNQIVLSGELDFDKTQHPSKIYKRLKKIAEDVGALVSTSGIRHGGQITVFPAYGAEYYVLSLYEKNEDPSTLQVMHVETWRRTGFIDLTESKGT